jgi:hypothetical protein
MERMVTFTDPVFDDVRYAVHVGGPGKPRWYRVEERQDGTEKRTHLTHVADPTPQAEG